MTRNSFKEHPPAQQGDNVTLNIPLVECSKSKLRNVICIIMIEHSRF